MHIKIEPKNGFTVVGMKYRGKNQKNEVPKLWEAFIPRMNEVPNRTESKISFGVMDNYDEETGEFDYIAGVAVDSDKSIPDGMVSHTVPEQTYAVFRCTLPTLHPTFQHIYQEWLPESGHERSKGPELEIYNEEFHVDETLYLYIPLMPK
ncbi:MAG TPA: AraC family transcriptional regulator [Anaerolineae bacterium]|nr:AraC family transcriptional regulator [Anaerolineae bacterium]